MQQKRFALKEVSRVGKPLTEMAKELNISPSSLYRWKREFDPNRSNTREKYIARQLENHLCKVSEERKILLRALQILACELNEQVSLSHLNK
ncbi:transposase [Alteromonas macleodii]|uniref:transposase n=1 Tax=Alteromonas macleodii TaxID=28108 RepID=UPI0034667BFF|nr:transposase [Alteromonas macleodii]